MPVSVRPSRESDLAAIAAIYAHHVLNSLASFELAPPDSAEIARRRAEILQRGLPFLVAAEGDVVLGYAYAAPYRARQAYQHTLEDSIYVDKDAIGRGVGRMLLDALLAECERGGYRQIIAVIGDSANAGSIGLHQACGFSRVGLLPGVGYKFGRWVDSVVMQRPLGSGAALPPERSGFATS